METVLPKKTPSEVIKWVEKVEGYYPVLALSQLPVDAKTVEIKEAFYSDRSTLMGIGEALEEAARWDAWSSHEDHLENS